MALISVLNRGLAGQTYNIGGNAEIRNLDLIHRVCDILDELIPVHERRRSGSHRQLISFVDDRAAHDFRYAIEISKIKQYLGWSPAERIETGLYKTVSWYVGRHLAAG